MMVTVTKDNFEKEVTQSEAVVVADFWATWCVPCKMMEPVLEKIEGDHGDKVKIAKINVDDNQELAAQFNIVSIPSLIVFHKGEMKDMHVGVVSQQALEKILGDYL
jgi:thioredoxin 1